MLTHTAFHSDDVVCKKKCTFKLISAPGNAYRSILLTEWCLVLELKSLHLTLALCLTPVPLLQLLVLANGSSSWHLLAGRQGLSWLQEPRGQEIGLSLRVGLADKPATLLGHPLSEQKEVAWCLSSLRLVVSGFFFCPVTIVASTLAGKESQMKHLCLTIKLEIIELSKGYATAQEYPWVLNKDTCDVPVW